MTAHTYILPTAAIALLFITIVIIFSIIRAIPQARHANEFQFEQRQFIVWQLLWLLTLWGWFLTYFFMLPPW